jgi:hypothetical protein
MRARLVAAVLLAVALPATPAFAQHDVATWTSQTTGTVAGVGFAVTGFNPSWGTNPTTFNGADFAAGELGTVTAADFGANDAWTVHFASPVTNLRLYAYAWRGAFNAAGLDPDVSYTFSSSFDILSGFSGVSVVGDGCVLPGDRFHFGILEFAGTLSSLSVTSMGALNASAQSLTFTALAPPVSVPEPGSLALLGVGLALLAMAASRRDAMRG